jgi:putative tryptophan/tyrosine transport system substrate-binding protein
MKGALVLAFAMALLAGHASAQGTVKLPRIGLLSAGADPADPILFVPFFARMSELGYVEGRTVAYERRFTAGRSDLMPEYAAELVRSKVDVIVCTGTPETLSAKQATSTIPIVMMLVVDPVALGLAATLARPGGNVTGMTTSATDVSSKRLELLREVVPGLSNAAVLLDPVNSLHNARAAWVVGLQDAARGLGIGIELFEMRGPDELEGLFARMAARGIGGAMIPQNGRFLAYRHEIARAAVKHRIPTMADRTEYAAAGMTLGYGPHQPELARRVAEFVDKLLKGAPAASLPIEQPTMFKLLVNLKTARELGITVPPALLARADDIIE